MKVPEAEVVVERYSHRIDMVHPKQYRVEIEVAGVRFLPDPHTNDHGFMTKTRANNLGRKIAKLFNVKFVPAG
ncbi:MAG: hypothetical protein WCO10_02190 [bacterium]